MRISPHAFALAALLSVTMLAVAGRTPSRAEAFDYVTNGGFEDGTLGWATSGDVDVSVVDGTSSPPREGQFSVRITLGQTPPLIVLRQTVWLGTPAGTYRVSASVRVENATSSVDILVNAGPASNGLYLSASGASHQWQDLSRDFSLIGVSNIVFTVGVHGAPGDVVYIDDVRFEGADPATMTPTATATAPPSSTPSPDASATRTPTGTRTASPTKTPTETPSAAVLSGPLRNSGFETVTDDGAPADWQKYGGTLDSSDGARTGTRAARLKSDTDSTKWLYQTVLVDGDASYEFSAWLLHDDPNVSSAFLRVSWYASDEGSGTASTTNDSTERLSSPSPEYRDLTTGAITAPPDARSARLRIMLAPASGAAATILADDAAFESTLAPETEAAAPAETPPGAASANSAGSDGDTGPIANNSRARSLIDAPDGSAAAHHVVINEVLYDPDGTGADSDEEWVEIYNPTDQTFALADWSLTDAVSSVHLLPSNIGPHQFVVIAASDSLFPASTQLISLGRRIGNGLGNDGDRLLLRDPSGALVDAISWGSDTTVLSPAVADVPEGHSIERRNAGQDTNEAADFSDNVHPSPGSALGATSAVASARTTVDEAPRTLASRERRFAWLPWALAASMSAALLVVMSWRAAPTLVQRLRQHS